MLLLIATSCFAVKIFARLVSCPFAAAASFMYRTYCCRFIIGMSFTGSCEP